MHQGFNEDTLRASVLELGDLPWSQVLCPPALDFPFFRFPYWGPAMLLTAPPVYDAVALHLGLYEKLRRYQKLAISSCVKTRVKHTTTVRKTDRTGTQIVPLFNPRKQNWHEYFRLEGAQVVGSATIGQATVRLLRLNDPERVASRQILIEAGLYPPQF